MENQNQTVPSGDSPDVGGGQLPEADRQVPLRPFYPAPRIKHWGSALAGFAGVLVMLIGLAATVQLTQTNQDIRQSAADVAPTASPSGQIRDVIHQTVVE